MQKFEDLRAQDAAQTVVCSSLFLERQHMAVLRLDLTECLPSTDANLSSPLPAIVSALPPDNDASGARTHARQGDRSVSQPAAEQQQADARGGKYASVDACYCGVHALSVSTCFSMNQSLAEPNAVGLPPDLLSRQTNTKPADKQNEDKSEKQSEKRPRVDNNKQKKVADEPEEEEEDDEEEDEEFLVEQILGHRIDPVDGKIKFLVRWEVSAFAPPVQTTSFGTCACQVASWAVHATPQ